MKNIHVLPTDRPSKLRYFDGKIELMYLIPKKSDIKFQNIYITSDEDIKEGDWIIHNVEVYKVTKSKESYISVEGLNHIDIRTDLCKKIILTTDQDLIKDGVQAIDDEFLEWFVKNPSCEGVEIKCNYDTDLRIVNGKNLGYYYITIPQQEPNPFELPKALPDEVFYESLEAKQTVQEHEQQCLDVALEEAAINYAKQFNYAEDSSPQIDFTEGAKWQAEQLFKDDAIQTLEKGLALLLKKQERMYSEQEVFELITNCLLATGKAIKAEMKNIMTNDAYIEFSGSDLEKWFKQNKKK
jgi:hypothetical protein